MPTIFTNIDVADDIVIYFSCNSISENETKLSLDLANVSHSLKKKIEHFLNLKKMESSLYGTGQRLKISGTSSVASGGVGAAPPGPVEPGKSSLWMDLFSLE